MLFLDGGKIEKWEFLSSREVKWECMKQNKIDIDNNNNKLYWLKTVTYMGVKLIQNIKTRLVDSGRRRARKKAVKKTHVDWLWEWWVVVRG